MCKLFKYFILLYLLGLAIPVMSYDFMVNGLCYKILSKTEKKVKVTWKASKDYYKGNIVIPDNVTHQGISYTVTAIGDYAFTNVSIGSLDANGEITGAGIGYNDELLSVKLPSTLTTIDNDAFTNCRKLMDIVFPTNLESIGYRAFSGCDSFQNVDLSSTHVVSIKEFAFGFCDNLNKIILPNTIVSLANIVGSSISLKEIYLDETNKYYTVKDGVLFDKDMKTLVFLLPGKKGTYYVPNGVKTIGRYAFYGCNSLKDVRSEITNPFEIDVDVFYNIPTDARLHVPQGTINKYKALTGWTAHFKEIVEYGGTTTYSLSITSSGSGYVTFAGTTINGTTKSFTVNSGASATLTFTPNSGYRVGSLKVNNVDVTSSISNNKYTISNITKNTTVSVTFEAIPVTTYSLSITSSGSGYVTFAGTTINGATKTFTVNSGASATLTFTPNSGYRVGSLKVNNVDVTSSISNNKYTISNITKNTTVNVTFEAIPVTTYSLSITSSGNGYVTYSGTTINGTTKSFTVNSGASATLTFTPNSGYRVGSLKVNNVDVTSSISNNQYTISNINKNTTVSVTFEVIPILKLTYNGVNYSILSHTDHTANVANGSYGQSLEVPASFVVDGVTWKVRGIDNDVITNNPQLAAIIWNPSVKFEVVNVSNPNILLYVTSAEYATQAITNVIVAGTANKIVLTEAASGNDFYCPQEFMAKQISYTHNYSMTTGINESRGWETIVLPFDVQLISHAKKGEIIPFAKWSSGDSRRPFWLYQLTSNGWSEADGIKAYTPYIISMPNNNQYYDEARLNGNVTFSATSVRVEPTTASTATYQGKTFTPCFTTKAANTGVFALNVKNQWTSETNGQKEGSTFVQNLRTIHPFEAYMTTTNTTRSSFGIFEDMTTGIRGITELMDKRQMKGVYNLKGQKIKVEADKKLPAGVYVINGQKVIVK